MQGSVGEKCTRAQGQLSTPDQNFRSATSSILFFTPHVGMGRLIAGEGRRKFLLMRTI